MSVPPAFVWVFVTTVYVAVAVVTGALLSRLLEIPSLALRDRLYPSAVKSSAVADEVTRPKDDQPSRTRLVTSAATSSVDAQSGAVS